MKRSLLSSIAGIVCAVSTDAYAADPETKFFEEQILPIFENHCFECHSHESGKSKGGLVLDSKHGWETGGELGPVIVPGKPDESLLITAVEYKDEDLEMPPKERLSPDQVAVLRKWISDGAADPRVTIPDLAGVPEVSEVWSFQPVGKPIPPSPREPAWATTEVDRFVLARLEAGKLSPLQDADPRTRVRRLFLDLTGLPPSPEEFGRWSGAGDLAPLVDELLASPQFGECWARHWFDTARYAESNGNNRNRVFRYAWRYRDWVIDAINDDLPYDQFLMLQLAGDLMPAKNPEQRNKQRIATGFLAIGPKPYYPTIVPLDPDEPDRARYDWAAEQIEATTSGMLGLTVACARCHDHKFDPIPTRDYYALAGIFRSTEPRFGMYYHLFGVPEGQAQRDFLYDWNLLVLNDDILPEIKPLQDEYTPLAMEENRLRRHLAHDPRKIANLEQKDPRSEEIARLREKITADEKRLAEVLALKAQKKAAFEYEVDQAMGVEEGAEPSDVHLRIAGDHARRGPLVPRGFVSTIQFDGAPSSIDQAQSGRLQLAEWIVHPNNPLTARVAVNRIWYHLFGRGLVSTLDNLGVSGEAPTHPDLLDHLAHKFVHEFGWSSKKMIRYLVSSRTYALASDGALATPDHFETDPDNALYWRTAPRRISAEAIRDSMLAVSGKLDRSRPKSSPLTDFDYGADIHHSDLPKALDLIDGHHRTVYVPTLRGHRTRLYNLFDYPDDETVNSARNASTVPTQALYLMNNPLVQSYAGALAERSAAQEDVAARLTLLYQLAYNRAPTTAELATDQAFLNSQDSKDPWADLAQSLITSGEFLFRL